MKLQTYFIPYRLQTLCICCWTCSSMKQSVLEHRLGQDDECKLLLTDFMLAFNLFHVGCWTRLSTTRLSWSTSPARMTSASCSQWVLGTHSRDMGSPSQETPNTSKCLTTRYSNTEKTVGSHDTLV